MRKVILNIILIISLLFLSVSCDEKTDKEKQLYNNQMVEQKGIRETLEEFNRSMLAQESENIDNYVECHELDVVRTGTGLRYQIVESGYGELIKNADVVTIEYEIHKLNGELIYSSEKDGVKTFLVGKGGVESGLEEVVLKLRKNSEALLILPSHLAHGLLGDGNKIPARATLIYRVKVIDIK